MTPAIQPTPQTWILRFKHHRKTVMLHVDPLQKLSSVREELLKAIRQTSPSGQLDGHDIPEDASDILLAKPVDINNLAAGWEPIEQDNALETDAEDKKGKGKATATATKGRPKKESITDCPQGVGFRDGGVVAFKFRSEAEAAKKEEDEGIDVEEDKLDGETLVGEPAAEQWDVVIPTMEETYGDEQAAALGEEGVPASLTAK